MYFAIVGKDTRLQRGKWSTHISHRDCSNEPHDRDERAVDTYAIVDRVT